MKWSVIDRWGTNPLLVDAFVDLINKELETIDDKIRDDVIILFSAHSLPMKVFKKSEPLTERRVKGRHYFLVRSTRRSISSRSWRDCSINYEQTTTC
jgi:protoheme ferro-lyase